MSTVEKELNLLRQTHHELAALVIREQPSGYELSREVGSAGQIQRSSSTGFGHQAYLHFTMHTINSQTPFCHHILSVRLAYWNIMSAICSRCN